MKWEIHKMSERLVPITDYIITPSSCGNKSENGSAPIISQLLDICGFGSTNLKDRIVKRSYPSANRALNFRYSFGRDDDEKKSYAPLQKHLTENNIFVVNVSSGQGLLDGNLFHEELWTLKKDPFAGPRQLRFIVRGRTDFVRIEQNNGNLSRINQRYLVEVKKGDIGEPALREAFVQLIGANTANTHHSPPVFLTNLQRSHYVLFITLESRTGETVPCYHLNIHQYSNFSEALSFVEDSTLRMRSCTADFLRKNTPLSTPPKKHRHDDGSQIDDDDDDDGHDFTGTNVDIQSFGEDEENEFREDFQSKLGVGNFGDEIYES